MISFLFWSILSLGLLAVTMMPRATLLVAIAIAMVYR